MERDFENAFPKPLSKDEERYYLERMSEGDKTAKDTLIMHNMRLVAHIAKKYYVLNENEDLISVGYFGLVKGVETFKLDKAFRLSTYLGRCIENEILMHLRKIKKYENCISLETELGKDPGDKEFNFESILADEGNENFAKTTNVFINKDQIVRLISCLNDLERKVIILRYGLEDGIDRPQREIAQILGFSRNYISRLEKRGIEKMRDELTYSERYKENHNNF